MRWTADMCLDNTASPPLCCMYTVKFDFTAKCAHLELQQASAGVKTTTAKHRWAETVSRPINTSFC